MNNKSRILAVRQFSGELVLGRQSNSRSTDWGVGMRLPSIFSGRWVTQAVCPALLGAVYSCTYMSLVHEPQPRIFCVDT